MNNASVSKVANNILVFKSELWFRAMGAKAVIESFLWAGAEVDVYEDGMSEVSEQRRKEDHDYRRPRAVDRQVIRLPAFEIREGSAAA